MNIEDKKRHARFMIRLLSVAMKAMEKGEAINGEILDVAIEGSAELVDLCKLMYEVRRSLPAFSKWSDYDIDALSKGVGEALKSGDRSEELMREVEKLDFETLAGIIFCAEFGAMPPYMKSFLHETRSRIAFVRAMRAIEGMTDCALCRALSNTLEKLATPSQMYV